MRTLNYGFPIPDGSDSFKAHRDFKALGNAIDEIMEQELGNIKNEISLQKYFVNVEGFGVKADGITDDAVALQSVFDNATAFGKEIFIPAKTYILTTGQMRTGDPSKNWGLKIPMGARVRIQKGAVFKLMANAPAWSRVVVLEDEVSITGELTIDGSAETINSGNEHMAGLFIYGKKNIYIESVHAYNCYGDNVQISGDGSNPCSNIVIDRVRCRKAGRKNLVLEASNGVEIGKAYLDNVEGNVANGWAGGNSLDVEPFDLGMFTMHNRINYLETIGTGNDFTSGRYEQNANKCILDVGTFVQKRGTLIVFGMTLNIDTAYFYEDVAMDSLAFDSLYASRININQLFFDGFGGGIIKAFQNGSDKPKFSIKKMTVRNTRNLTPTQAIFQWKGADIHIGTLDISNYDERIIWSEYTETSTFNIDQLISVNSGKSGGSALYLNYLTVKAAMRVGSMTIKDSRTTKVAKFIEFSDIEAMQNFGVTNIHNPDNVTLFGTQYGNFTAALKIAGIDEGCAIYMIDATPEGALTAPVGSIALRRNGGAGTTLYVKQSGTGNTGWVGK